MIKNMQSLGVSQVALAERLGISQAYLCLILHGKRPAPGGFEVKMELALMVLAKAEKAAQEARCKVLAAGNDPR